MTKKRSGVRVVFFSSGEFRSLADIDTFLECLRYAGIVNIERKHTNTKHTRTIVDILPPKDEVDDKTWSEANAKRMRSFGYNASSAPTWEQETLHTNIRKNSWGEYEGKVLDDDKMVNGIYYTGDIEDAKDTAMAMLEESRGVKKDGS